MFHINESTGEAGKCRAKTEDGCPFGNVSEHYNNADEARAAFEKQMSNETLTTHKTLYKPRRDKREDNMPSTAIDSKPVESPEGKLKQKISDFKKADLAYAQAMDTWNDETALHTHTPQTIQALRTKRDTLAFQVGERSVEENDRAKALENRANLYSQAEKVRILREKIKNNKTGPGTNRDRLRMAESQLLKKYIINRGTEPDELKEFKEINASVCLYNLEEARRRIDELGKVNVFSTSQRKTEHAELKRTLIVAEQKYKSATDKEKY